MRRSLEIGTALVLVYLVITATPAAAAQSVVASSHSTKTQFNSGSLTNASVVGSGSSASVRLGFDYSVVDDSGDGSVESGFPLYGDTGSNDPVKSEYKIVPDYSGEIETLVINAQGPPYQTTVDIYLVQENPDHQYGEGSLIVDGWEPSAGNQHRIDLDNNPNVDKGENYTLEFVTQGSNNDGNFDVASIDTDDSFTSTWSSASYSSTKSRGGDIRIIQQKSAGRYISPNHSVQGSTGGYADLTLENASAQVTWEGYDGSSWTTLSSSTYSSSSNFSQSWSEFSGDRVRVDVQFSNESGATTARLHSEGVFVEPKAPVIDDNTASPNSTATTIDQTPVTLSVDVGDRDFSRSIDEQVGVDFYVDGTLRGSDTLSSNGTASYTLSSIAAGQHDWHVEVSDEYSLTDTSNTAQFVLPSTLYVRPEKSPNGLVDNVDVTIRFYSDSTIVERSTSNGEIDMGGLPANEEFLVVAESPDHYNRRIYVRDLATQQDVYLLNQSATAVYNRFVLQDLTGDFQTADTRLIIQRALNTSGTINWTTIGGDFFGATNAYRIDLQENTRYRLTLRNDAGDVRVVGTYMAMDEANPKTIRVGRIDIETEGDERYIAQTNVTGTDSDRKVRVVFQDPEQNTTDYHVEIYERGNQSNIAYEDTVAGPLGNYSALVDIPENGTWVVNWSASRGGENISGTIPIGGFATGTPIPNPWQWVFSMLLIMWTATLSGVSDATRGAIVTCAIAGLAIGMGFIDIPIVFWFIATVIAVGGHIRATDGVI